MFLLDEWDDAVFQHLGVFGGIDGISGFNKAEFCDSFLGNGSVDQQLLGEFALGLELD